MKVNVLDSSYHQLLINGKLSRGSEVGGYLQNRNPWTLVARGCDLPADFSPGERNNTIIFKNGIYAFIRWEFISFVHEEKGWDK